jgi:DNA polymerase-4
VLRQIIHIDMDAFFAAVEQHDQPAYRGQPVIVGGDPKTRGVVSTCSYEARKFGVHSAMPSSQALRLCPMGIFLPGRMGRYLEVSSQIMTILKEYTPLVEQVSIDEAFLDVTGSEALFGSADEIALQIVERIEREVGLTASVGIAPNKFLAKLASDLKKPKGFVKVKLEEVQSLLNPLPVGRLWGVGPKTEESLHQMGIGTIGELSRIAPERLKKRFGELGMHLYLLANGVDDRPVQPEEEAKSIGHEVTFQEDSRDREFLTSILMKLSVKVARRVRQAGVGGRTITLKIRNSEFQTITRSRTLLHPTDDEGEIYRVVLELMEEAEWGRKPVRLLGVSLTQFTEEESDQLLLFSDEEQHINWKDLNQTLDKIRDRFGEQIIVRGRMMLEKKTSVDE